MLEQIKTIQDLKKLTVRELPELCAEIRQMLISNVLESGGHLASNLGVVELTVALHYVFDERDRIVWDVGHQSYVHKILTSRGENFSSLRSKDGVSGFPDCEEDGRDSFNTGHAGTAISAALGLAKARDTLHDDYKVIAVVGDGSMTCGLTYEALNNVKDTNMLIVLNDNNMSIGKNVGSATLNMSKLRVGKYDRNKERLKRFLLKIPLLGKPTYKFLRWCKRRAKLGYPRNSYFDNFDLKYVGIIDGNEVKDLVYYLTRIKNNVTKPTVLQIVTKKGKGYEPAEADPETYHSVNRKGAEVGALESSVVVGDTLCKIASEREDVVAICAAMAKATGLAAFQNQFPDRFYDVGIAEEHAVTFAAGLAKGGARPFVAIYSSFLQRSYDQILHDVALQNLPVTFLIDRAGFVGEDGKTHQGLFDLSYLSQIPNLKIWTPSTYSELSQMIQSSLHENCPVAIRYPKRLSSDKRDFVGRWNVLSPCDNPRLTLLAVGANQTNTALRIAEAVPSVEVVEVTTVKPLDANYLNSIKTNTQIVTLEENVLQGGFGQSVAEYIAKNNSGVPVINLGVNDTFVKHATVEEQLIANGLDFDSLLKTVTEILSNC
ncbi:MAG: 1-deoxy-D-xylulose-5-phosphate synthase [Clostridiales bacterium]|nr:1-deoxy-D-xylulose-5-phosphate synthase [Clostridiales bacterium]